MDDHDPKPLRLDVGPLCEAYLELCSARDAEASEPATTEPDPTPQDADDSIAPPREAMPPQDS